jgi:hypothetical protein
VKGVIRGDEWIAEIERLSTKNDRGQTAIEIGNALGRSVESVRRMLQRALDLGWLVRGTRTSTRIDGRTTAKTVYLIRRTATAKSKGRKR